MSFCKCGSHTIELYSKTDRIRDTDVSGSPAGWGQCLRFRLRKPRTEFAFLVILFIWDAHFKCSESIMPR